jgi:ubiquinone/menaquinone biosynthesis C-methylase UbiE
VRIEVTHAADGRVLSKRELAAPTLMGWIDEPDQQSITTPAGVLRCRGWIATQTGATATVTVSIDGEVVHKGPADLPRPDVLAAISSDFAVSESGCGFDVYAHLPAVSSSPLQLVVQITDGVEAGSVAVEVDRMPASPRSDYKSAWNAVAGDTQSAMLAVAGYTDDEAFASTAESTVELLEVTVGVKPEDVVLEIGAGVGRVGPAIAPRVARWIATDVSSNMLRHARERCAGLDNVDFVELSGWDLAPIATESVDVVYSTVVFMHLDEWDRYAYVKEAFRVLRPGGRLLVDNVNLVSTKGWSFFEATAEQYHPLERPSNISKTSTPEELETYLVRAGFVEVRTGSDPKLPWVTAWGEKPRS